MKEVLWMVLSVLAAFGICWIVSWLAGRSGRPRGVRWGYHVIPLYDDPERIEAQLRYGLRRLRWASGGSRTVVLMDMGLGEESRRLCEGFMRQNPGLLRCGGEDLVRTIRELDRLQQA